MVFELNYSNYGILYVQIMVFKYPSYDTQVTKPLYPSLFNDIKASKMMVSLVLALDELYRRENVQSDFPVQALY
jgi:hypothetical protein